MKASKKVTGRAVSIPVGLCYGEAVSIVITLLGVALTAKMISTETVAWDQTGYAILAILLVSSWCGAMISSAKIKRRKVLVCAISGAIHYAVLLIITALFFGAQFSGAGETLLVVLSGSMLAVFQSKEREKTFKSQKIRV